MKKTDSDTVNQALELAWNFIEKTDRNIFLTGKAGTGKTTFLHRVKYESLKRLVVVAPTGVAAINAKGVTIHSFFQMPFGPIIPDGSQFRQRDGYKMKFSRKKIDIIRSLDLLIIDEISMVRADLLDAIDQVLRRYKNRDKVFGGVQVLMIGDLQQLAPVVKPNEWDLLKSYYETAYFFSSKSFKDAQAISIELTHIYRQANEDFIRILNEVRTDTLSIKSAEALNKRFQPEFVPKKEDAYITLTTHNSRANKINEIELNKIKSESYKYSAQISGKFSEYAYPTSEELELKVGAQVMFIKNDSSFEKRYFNGKIGTITYLDKKEVIVHCTDDDSTITVTPEIWENVSYTIDPETKAIKEETTGSFAQIPLRLAWAITIHKSQGLTFEKAIIDAGASFAHGQTYVALSRCRTLEGIVLKTKITDRSIINDRRVESFTDEVAKNAPDEEVLNESEKVYQLNLIEELFNYHAFLYPIKRLTSIYYNNKNILKGNFIEPLINLQDKGIVPLLKVGNGFKIQLQQLSETITNPENDSIIQERIKKGIDYFILQTKEQIQKPLDELTFSTDNKAVKQDIKKMLNQIEEQLAYKLYCLQGLSDGFSIQKYLQIRAKAILENTQKPKKQKEYKDTTEHPELFEQLRELRSIISQSDSIPPFQVFTQQTLYELCEFFPVTTKQLLAINGMGKIRVNKYGEEILDTIKEYVEKYQLTPREVAEKKPKQEKGSSQKESLSLFKNGLNIVEIATQRGLAKTTIEGHLSEFILTGEIAITELLPEKRYLALKKIMEHTDFNGLSDLKNKVGDSYSYGEIRMVAKDFEYRKKKI
jgi:uncharacterized protein YpbB/GTPase SAR1 family protein